MSRRRVMRLGLVGALLAGGLTSVLLPLHTRPAAATTLPSGFQEQIVFSGLTQPTNMEFSPDGRVFVAEKGGKIKVFDDLADTTPTVFADLSTNVHNMWDRGLLGLALPPNFPTNPWVYVLYTYDAPPGQVAPVWNDACADGNNGTCVVTAQLSRLQAAGNVMTGSEQVLIHDWCQQYPSHSIGDLHFGQDGMLYVTGGDGASFSGVDYGQLVSASNPCGDPPGGSMMPPSAEGGALRSQDIRTTGDPTGLDGTVLRLDPTTGAAAAGNPNIGSADLNTRRIVAHGLRNPFRFTIRPGTNEVWAGDVGWNTWEEIDRLQNPTAPTTNFGWPCYEGAGRMSAYDNEDLTLCETLYTAGTATGPYYTYNHSAKVVSGESCPTGGSSVTGAAFYPTSGGPYPAAYQGGLFFADYSRGCIWAMLPSSPGGLPSTSNIITFGAGAASPVDLAVGPGSELYYVDLSGGTIRRIRYFPGNQPPNAAISAAPTGGPAPLTVNFSGTGSADPDPADQGKLTYAWDFTNDGTTDSTAANTSFTYNTAGTYTAKLTVTDTLGATGTATVSITPGNNAPTATIDTPTAGTTWKVGDTVSFTGHATDPQQGTLPASALTWHLRMQHCTTPTNCHTHFLQDYTGVASGSFIAPDHEYPSYLELELVATDQDGLTNSVIRRLDPKTVDLTFASNPSGLQLTVGSASGATPFTRTVIQGSTNTVSAPSPQTLGGNTYTFASWSDSGAQSHVITAPTAPATYTAAYNGTGNVNLALNRPAVADSQCATTEGPEKAVNGTVNGGWSDKWCSLGASKWLRVDLGSNVAISQFVVRHANAGGEGAIANTRDFSIEVSQDATAWTTAVTVTGNTADVTTHNVSTNGRYARLSVQKPAQDNDNAARIYEFEVYGVSAPPPPPPPPAVVQGTVTSSSGGTAIAGATVTVSGTSLSTTTAANGTYSFADVPTGTRTITASKAGFLPGSTTVTATSGTTVTGNITLNPAPACADAFGYTCTSGPRTFVPADQTVLTLKGDDSVQQITLPFPIKFYGSTYTTAWLDTNGLLSFATLASSAWDHSSIPSAPAANKANLAVYPFWDDLDVDSSASVRTAVTGTAPNRKFTVEWRNVKFFVNSSARVNFEVTFEETTNTITFAYSGIDAVAVEQGSMATVGIENGNGTVAIQTSFNQATLSNGNGVTFTPPA
ncbi:MAG TPA: PQQ-dependent sugar dehydrogenase [Micromonosporaceae bacterium]|nr:PQQ-dependent sugar dehydrogenase [Micromonosporaceae bacterium]